MQHNIHLAGSLSQDEWGDRRYYDGHAGFSDGDGWSGEPNDMHNGYLCAAWGSGDGKGVGFYDIGGPARLHLTTLVQLPPSYCLLAISLSWAIWHTGLKVRYACVSG